jgi:hypothetical protein
VSTLYCYTSLYNNKNRPQNVKELFNLRYISLRNVIKWIFGVIKRKYKILNTLLKYLIDTQLDLILGLTVLHNFCRGLDGSKVDNYITKLEGGDKDLLLEEDTIVVDQGGSLKDLELKAIELKRDQIAKQI